MSTCAYISLNTPELSFLVEKRTAIYKSSVPEYFINTHGLRLVISILGHSC